MTCQSMLILALVFLGAVISPQVSSGQDRSASGIYLILDASGSMEAMLSQNQNRMTEAKQVLQDFLKGDFSGKELALRVYGHRKKGDCTDSHLVIPFTASEQARLQLKDLIPNIKPLGKTPITYSLQEALKDFGNRQGDIILISDGIETCNADPCALMKEWKDKNVGIKVHVVGLGLDQKSKSALQCISTISGTTFFDAQSASSLSESLKQIQKKAAAPALIIKGQDSAGKELAIHGLLAQNGQNLFKLTSRQRYAVPPGSYQITAGVLTKNGNLYRPVTQNVEVLQEGDTAVMLTVPVPPTVRVQFLDEGGPQPGSIVRALQNGKELFHFRWQDEVFLDEGTYEFRATPRGQQELSLSETFAAGDRKVISFQLEYAVGIKINLRPGVTGVPLRKNVELWQQGGKKYDVHVVNGARVKPGTYDIVFSDALLGYTQKGVVIGPEAEQTIEVVLPVGNVRVLYQNADGSKAPEKRCFIGKGPQGSGHYRMSGEPLPLLPGTYNLKGWGGVYDPVVFEVQSGEDKILILRSKK